MKTTKATIKSFIRKNEGNLYINIKSRFDGMTDCVESVAGQFQKAKKTTDYTENTLGIQGAWFVGQSRDYFKSFKDNQLTGYEVSNCCGHFIIAIKDNL